jgi:hypothetical protein
MGRSGSTWVFNVAKALLSRETLAITGEYNNAVGAALAALDPRVEHHLIKAHMVDHVGHMLIRHRMCRTLCTWREPLDCIASSIEAFGSAFENTVALARGGLAFLDLQSRAGGVLFVAYDDIVARPHDTIRAIGHYLGCPAGDAEVQRIATLFSKDNVQRFADKLERTTDERGGSAGWDPDTLLYPGHIRAAPSPPDQLLSPDQLRQAITGLAPFVDPDGRLARDLKQRLTGGAA